MAGNHGGGNKGKYFTGIRLLLLKEYLEANAGKDRFGKDVVMRPLDDGHFTVVVPVEISPPFFAWIATFGRRVKILSPEPVIEEMRNFLEKSLDMVKKDGEM